MNLDLSSCLAQTRAFNAFRPGNRVALAFGRGVGKSWLMRQLWYCLIAKYGHVERLRLDGQIQRGVRIVLAMPTLTQARKVHFGASPGLIDEINGPWSFLGGKLNQSTWRVEFKEYNSWIQFVPTDSVGSSRGIRTDVASFDEADDIEESFYTGVGGPWFTEPHSLNMTLVAGTPKRGRRGFLYTAFKEWPKKLPGKAFGFHATAYDTKHVSRAVVDEQRLTTPEEIFKREWLCDFDATEGTVYSEFNEQFHVRKPDEATQRNIHTILVGGDHGHQDPSVLLVIGISGKGRDSTAWVLEEHYESGRDPFYWKAVAEKIVARFPQAFWYCDPSGMGGSSNAMYRLVGANIRPVDKSGGSVEKGIGIIKRWLKVHVVRKPDSIEVLREYARLYVHPKCDKTIREFALYRHRRDPRDSNIVMENIVSGNDHAMDSLRYALVNHFPDVFNGYGLEHLTA